MKEIVGYMMAHVPILKMEEEKPETKLVVYYDIQDISAPTTIFTNYDNSVKSIEVDGVLLDSVATTYQFNSVGEHVIKYEFNDPTTVGNSAPIFNIIMTVKRVIIPNTFTAIGKNAFNGCSSLTSVIVGNSVTQIGEYAFNNCSGLNSVHISDLATWCNISFYNTSSNPLYYAHHLYLNGTEVTDLIIPDGVTSISTSAFSGCSGLTSVTIPNNVTSIGPRTFEDCISLTSVNVGNSVTSIGSNAFYGCSILDSITSLATTAPSIFGSTFQNVNTNGTLTVPSGSSGYDVWMGTGNYYLGSYGWTKVEQ